MSSISVSPSRQKRRRHAPAFKADIVAACRQPGASVSRIALDNGLNANMVRRWISEAERAAGTAPAFVPLRLPPASTPGQATPTHPAIRIEIPRAAGAVIVEWPVEQANQCLALLRELLR
ncbi:MAG TPA: transposase [Gammaproteobacteria bacterium]|nr:transposase [Gammaproteobacteria bacterium]